MNIRKLFGQVRLLPLIVLCGLPYLYLHVFSVFLHDRVLPGSTATNAPATAKAAPIPVSAGSLLIGENDHGVRYRALVVKPRSLELFLDDDHSQGLGHFQDLKQQLSRNGKDLAFAMNAGIYGQDGRPLGLHVENGNLIRSLNVPDYTQHRQGNFFLLPNGVFQIRNGEASIVESGTLANVTDWKGVSLAVQSGPMLVMNGSVHPEFSRDSPNRTVRNGVGIIDKDSVVLIITDDPISLYDFAIIFRERFNCQDALYLDGAISEMYVAEIDGENVSNGTFAGMLAVTVPMRKE